MYEILKRKLSVGHLVYYLRPHQGDYLAANGIKRIRKTAICYIFSYLPLKRALNKPEDQ